MSLLPTLAVKSTGKGNKKESVIEKILVRVGAMPSLSATTTYKNRSVVVPLRLTNSFQSEL